MKFTICILCKNKFFQNSNVQKICSNLCRKKFQKLYRKKYNKLHKKDISKYYYKNREKYAEWHKKYNKNKRKVNFNFRILCNLRLRMWHALKGNSKSSKTLNLLDCSIKQLKQHLRNKFTKGMSFTNYGKWHIDHIRPCASFDLRKKSEQYKCFNYTNLQPLWAKDNILKKDKFIRNINEV